MAISTCSWVLVLRGRMSRASARRVSTGFGIAGNYRVPTPPPFCFQYVDFSVQCCSLRVFFFLTTTTLFTNAVALCKCKGSKRRLMAVSPMLSMLLTEYGTFRCELDSLIPIVDCRCLQNFFVRACQAVAFHSVFLFDLFFLPDIFVLIFLCLVLWYSDLS